MRRCIAMLIDCQFAGVPRAPVPSWLHQANPQLSSYITELLGSDHWLTNLDELAKLRKFADDAKVQERWMAIKQANKVRRRRRAGARATRPMQRAAHHVPRQATPARARGRPSAPWRSTSRPPSVSPSTQTRCLTSR